MQAGAHLRAPFFDAYELAQSAAPDLAVARYRVELADSDRATAFGRIMPQVTLFGQFSDNRIEYDSELSVADQNFTDRGTAYSSVSHYSTCLMVRSFCLEFVKKQSQNEFAVAEAELLSLLMETFLGVLLADADLEQYETELKALERQLKEATALYERSLLPVTEVLETQTRTDTLRADLIMARGNTLIAREELSQLTGEDVEALASVADTFTLVNRFPSALAASQQASLNSPVVAAAEAAVDAARKQVDRERARRYPGRST